MCGVWLVPDQARAELFWKSRQVPVAPPLQRGRPCPCGESPGPVQGGDRPSHRPRGGGCCPLPLLRPPAAGPAPARPRHGRRPAPTWPPPPQRPPPPRACASAMQRAARPLLRALLRAAPPWRPRRPPPAPPLRLPPLRRPFCSAAAPGPPPAASYRLVYTCKVGGGGPGGRGRSGV